MTKSAYQEYKNNTILISNLVRTVFLIYFVGN